MSHHIHSLPQLLPLEGLLKPDKKRPLRKIRSRGVSRTNDVDDIESLDDIFDVSYDEPIEAAADEDFAGLIGTCFSGANMKELLQAQEDS